MEAAGQRSSGREVPVQVVEEDLEDSWETADLEEKIKALKPPSFEQTEGGQTSRISADGRGADDGLLALQNDGVSSPNEDGDRFLEVDGFLKDALQNSRDRLTILRMEQEIEKFMGNGQLQQYDFAPTSSSYLRLVAHRVAQHYGLQTFAMPEQPSIICARKTIDCRFPRVKLCEVTPVAPTAHRSTASLPVHPGAKLAIKQRPNNGGSGDGGSGKFRIGPQKSVEERKEDYNRARARIFSSSSPSGSSNDLQSQGEEASKPDKDVVATANGESPEPVREGAVPSQKERGFEISGGLSRSSSGNDGKGRGRGVAIFRDKEKEKMDPDFDRSYDRYGAQYGYGMTQMAAYPVQGVYSPVAAYNSEFPSLASASSRGGSPAPQPMATQAMPAPWMGPMGTSYAPSEMVYTSGNTHPSGAYANGAMYMQPPMASMPYGPNMYVQQENYMQPQQYDPRYVAQRRR